MFIEVIATAFLEFLEERGGPIGIVYLIRVVEKVVRPGCRTSGKRTVETVEVVTHGISVKMVDDIPSPTGSRPLHLLASAALILCDDEPLSRQAKHFQLSVFHRTHHVDAAPFVALHINGKSLNAFELCKAPLFLIANADVYSHRLVGGTFDNNGVDNKDHLARRLLDRYLRSSKRPSRTRVHIDEDTIFFSFCLHLLQGRHPLWREKRDGMCLIALYSIDGRYLHRTRPY